MLARDLRERLIGALQHSLRADVLPAAGGQAAPRDQPAALELVEDLGRRPAPDQVAVGQQHGGRARTGRQDRNRLAGLDDQRLAIAQLTQCGDDRVEALLVAGRLGVRGVDDQVLGVLGDREVVLEQPQDRLLAPAATAQRRVRHGTARGPCSRPRSARARQPLQHAGRPRPGPRARTPRSRGRAGGGPRTGSSRPRSRAATGSISHSSSGSSTSTSASAPGIRLPLRGHSPKRRAGASQTSRTSSSTPERVVDQRHDQLDARRARGEREDVRAVLALGRPADVVGRDQIKPVGRQRRRAQRRVDLRLAAAAQAARSRRAAGSGGRSRR